MKDYSEVLRGENPPGVKLSRINEILCRFGLVLVIGVVIDSADESRLAWRDTRIWIERL
jgi:hypothetical protein